MKIFFYLVIVLFSTLCLAADPPKSNPNELTLNHVENTEALSVPKSIDNIKKLAKNCSTNTFSCFQAFTDAKHTKWIVHRCEKVESFKKGLYVHDSKGLRSFDFTPKEIFDFTCGEGCIGCDYTATTRTGEIISMRLSWDINESAGHVSLNPKSKSKLEVEECVELGLASDPPAKWDCKKKK